MLDIIESEETKKEISILKDVDVSWISLVAHGANREPFKIMKTADGGQMDVTKIIQSVLVPHTASLETAAKKENLEWLTEVTKSEPVKYESYMEYSQAPKEKFENLSFRVVSKEDGIVAVVGTLKPIVAKEAGNLLSLPENPMHMPVATEMVPYDRTAGDVFYKEVYGMVDTIEGIMRQSSYSPADRKKAVLQSAAAFSTFLNMWTDAISGMDLTAAKFDKSSLVEILTTNGGHKSMNKDELQAMTEAIQKAIQPLVEAKEEPPPVVPPVEPKPQAPETIQLPEEVIEKLKSLDSVIAKNKELEETLKKIQAKQDHEPETDPVAGTADPPDDDPEPKAAADTSSYEGLPADKRAGIFAGLVFDPKKVAALRRG